PHPVARHTMPPRPPTIEKGPPPTAAVAHHQHRVFAHIRREEIARLRDLALVAQKKPAARKNPVQFLFVNLPFDENAATDQTAIGIDETGYIRIHETPPQAVTATPAQLSAATSCAQRR